MRICLGEDCVSSGETTNRTLTISWIVNRKGIANLPEEVSENRPEGERERDSDALTELCCRGFVMSGVRNVEQMLTYS